MSKRKARIPDKVKWAAALLTIRHEVGGRLVPCISYAEAKTLTADQIIARFDHHHVILEHFGGVTEPWNIQPMLRPEHRKRTAKLDIPAVAKGKRIAKIEAKHKAKMAEKLLPVDVTGELGGRSERPKPRWPSRPMKSRGFPTKAERERAKAWREQRGR
jgi:hypothetical protein